MGMISYTDEYGFYGDPTKRIDGTVFKFHAATETKQDAVRESNKLRKSGWKARVIPFYAGGTGFEYNWNVYKQR